MGGLNDNDDEENDFVFDDGNLTWSEIAQASGVGEDAYNFRSQASSSSKEARATTSKGTKRRSSTSQLIDEEEEIGLKETDEDSVGHKSETSSNDDNDMIEKNDEDFDDLDIWSFFSLIWIMCITFIS